MQKQFRQRKNIKGQIIFITGLPGMLKSFAEMAREISLFPNRSFTIPMPVEIINSIAMAKVRVQMYTFNYSELLSFHYIDHRWVIVNKMIPDMI